MKLGNKINEMRATQHEELKQRIFDIFGKIYTFDKNIFVPLEDNKTKVKNIKKVKDYLNNNTSLYVLEIVFLGGVAQDYNTAMKIRILE